MAGGFFKNVGADARQLIEESFLSVYKSRFTFLDEAFRYKYVRYNNYPEEQIYTYKTLLRELQKNNIDIADINIVPVDTVPMFGTLRLTCLFKDKEKQSVVKSVVIKVVSQNLEHIMDDCYSDDNKV